MEDTNAESGNAQPTAAADKLAQHGEAFAGFAQGVQTNVLNAITEQSVGPEGFIENVQAFRHAVDWSEHWIQGVLAFHVLLVIFFVLTRNRFHVQVGLFFVIFVLARSSEYINTYLRHHWRDFSRQNYFNENGLFISVMWAGPLIILGFAMLINFLRMCATMLVTVKAAQIKREMKARKKAGKVGNTGNIGATDKEPSKQD